MKADVNDIGDELSLDVVLVMLRRCEDVLIGRLANCRGPAAVNDTSAPRFMLIGRLCARAAFIALDCILGTRCCAGWSLSNCAVYLADKFCSTSK